MRIQYLNGGLANQVFQYIFFRFGQLSNPESADEWFLDDSFFYIHNIHNGYELEKVFPNIKVNLLSKFFDKESWDMLIDNKRNGISIPQSLKNLGYDIKMITETSNYNEKMHNPFDGLVYKAPDVNGYFPEIVKLKDEIIYYHGYWINPMYAMAYSEQIFSELTFRDITDEKNAKIALDILKTDSCAVHIRRGDYVELGWSSPTEFYKKSIDSLFDKNKEIVLFVFSDDIEWCKQHSSDLGLDIPSRVEYVEGNVAGNNYIDLQLMTYAKYIIRGNSAFSYLARVLSERCCEMISVR